MTHMPAVRRVLAAALVVGSLLLVPAPSRAADADKPAAAKAPWVEKDPKQWPQILMTNDGFFKDKSRWGGAGAFLLKLPNGAVVAATAHHILGEDADVSKIGAWSMYPHGGPASKRVTVKNPVLAIAPDQAKPLDTLFLVIGPVHPWPAEVLAGRETPVTVGEDVFLIAASNQDKAPQNVYKGKVTRLINEDQEFVYEFEFNGATSGFSGAPVIDANGLAVGIHHGKLVDQPGGGKIAATANALAPALKFATAAAPTGAEAAPATASPAATPAATPAAGATNTPAAAATSAAGDDAEKAAKELAMAKNYVTLKRYDTARPRLQKLVTTYPNTPAAREAMRILQEIEGK